MAMTANAQTTAASHGWRDSAPSMSKTSLNVPPACCAARSAADSIMPPVARVASSGFMTRTWLRSTLSRMRRVLSLL